MHVRNFTAGGQASECFKFRQALGELAERSQRVDGQGLPAAMELRREIDSMSNSRVLETFSKVEQHHGRLDEIAGERRSLHTKRKVLFGAAIVSLGMAGCVLYANRFPSQWIGLAVGGLGVAGLFTVNQFLDAQKYDFQALTRDEKGLKTEIGFDQRSFESQWDTKGPEFQQRLEQARETFTRYYGAIPVADREVLIEEDGVQIGDSWVPTST